MAKTQISIAVRAYNIERWFYLRGFRFVAQIIYHAMQVFLGCTIPPSAELSGVEIAHFHGIVIHHESCIGKGSVIYQNVTIGGRNGRVAPMIGENCILGAGCCVLGDVTLGDNVHVGANAVVLQDVPSNCTVVGIPARIIKKHKVD